MKNLSIVAVALLSLCFSACSEADALVKPEAMIEKVKDAFAKIGTSADSIKDDATAKSANTEITGLIGKLTSVVAIAKKLPAGGGTKILEMVKSQAGPLLGKLSAVAPNLKQHVGDAIAKLTELTK